MQPPARGSGGGACFSFAAYAKAVITHLRSCNIHIGPGLTEAEFGFLESRLGFQFPADLRSILSEGVPVGPGFPHWRTPSLHQLGLLISLPIMELSQEVSRNSFWIRSWGDRPDSNPVDLADRYLRRAPVLVPIYRYCYIPATPCLAGNPVLYVHGGDVRVLSFDVVGFFDEVEFWRKDWFSRPSGLAEMTRLGGGELEYSRPAWAAKEAREVDFWTEAAAESARGKTRRGEWWNRDDDDDDIELGLGLGLSLEGMMWRLRDGGWREEEVREMMNLNSNCSYNSK